MHYFAEVDAVVVARDLRDAAAKACTATDPQHPPKRIRYFTPETRDETNYAKTYGCRDWSWFRTARDILARTARGELWLRVDGANAERIAAAVKSKLKRELN